MKTIDLMKNIPGWIDAKEPEQFKDELVTAYERDRDKLTNVYDRGTDRFFIIKKQPVKSLKGWLVKRHILRIMDIMDKNHKPELLTPKDKIKLSRSVIKADKSRHSLKTLSGTSAKTIYWQT